MSHLADANELILVVAKGGHFCFCSRFGDLLLYDRYYSCYDYMNADVCSFARDQPTTFGYRLEAVLLDQSLPLAKPSTSPMLMTVRIANTYSTFFRLIAYTVISNVETPI